MWVEKRMCVLECQQGVNYGSGCNKQCSYRHCLQDSTCDKKLGTCVGGCQPGWSEPDCSQGNDVNVCFVYNSRNNRLINVE